MRTIQRALPISSHVYADVDSALASNSAPSSSVSIRGWFLYPFVAEHVIFQRQAHHEQLRETPILLTGDGAYSSS